MNLSIIQLSILNINDCVDLDTKSLNGLWTRSQWETELSDPKRICIGIIELKTKKILGLCTAWSVLDELHITSLAVHPLHQRKGLGKFLISDLTNRSYSLRVKKIHLEVKDINEPAIAFYKSMGFKIVGNRPSFYKDGSDALIFSRQLIKKYKRTN